MPTAISSRMPLRHSGMQLETLYDHLLAKNGEGLSYDEAVQLFLWLYCSTDILPPALRTVPLGKEVLVDTFQRLTREGLVIDRGQAEPPRKHLPWGDLVDELLSKRIALDESFPARVDRYL